MSIKAVVLLSGGLDSVYNLYRSEKSWPGQVCALSINYGQRAWVNELKAAKYFTSYLKVDLQTIDMRGLFSFDKSALTEISHSVPTETVNIENREASVESAKGVWVSNRNGVFLNVAACLAESLGAQWIVPGFNLEEAATFPDNSVDYIEKMNACLKMSTANGVQIQCFSQEMNKDQIYRESVELGAPMDHIWPCYFSGDQICGKCESCQRFLRAKNSFR